MIDKGEGPKFEVVTSTWYQYLFKGTCFPWSSVPETYWSIFRVRKLIVLGFNYVFLFSFFYYFLYTLPFSDPSCADTYVVLAMGTIHT